MFIAPLERALPGVFTGIILADEMQHLWRNLKERNQFLCSRAAVVFIAAVPTLHLTGIRDHVPLALKSRSENVHKLR